MRFSEPLAFTSLFPYVYFMIRDFGIAEDEASISKYAGYLSASFALTQFIFSIQWGKLSERIGRKPVLLFGLFGTSMCMLVFGFSPNFYVAIAARSLMGALNGNIAVLRTLIGETATERNHQAVAFSTLPLLWNVGSVVGPLIGGSKYLTRPKQDNPYDPHIEAADGLKQFYNQFLDKHPYALSNIVVAIVLWFGMVVGFLFLEETHYKAKYKKDYGVEMGDFLLQRIGISTPVRPWQKKSKRSKTNQRNLESQPLLTEALDESNDSSVGNDSDDMDADTTMPPQQLYSSVQEDNESIESGESVGLLSRRMSTAIIRRYSSKSTLRPEISRTFSHISGLSISRIETELEDSTMKEIFTPAVVHTLSANALLAFHTVIYGEFLPVFLASKLKADLLSFPFGISGGFGFDSDFIGSLFSTTGLCGVFVVALVFPYLDRNFKAVHNYRVSQFVFPVVYCALPFYIFTLHEVNPRFSTETAKNLLYFNALVYQLASSTAFPQLVLLVHRSAKARHRAFVNSAAISLNSLSRFVAPLTWGYLMSYFDSKGHAGFTWFVLAFMPFLGLIQAFMMKEYDEDLR